MCETLQMSFAQDIGIQWKHLNNIRQNTFIADSTEHLLDSIGILPSTLIIKTATSDSTITPQQYSLNPITGKIIITDSTLYGQEIKTTFRVLPYPIQSVYRKKIFPGYTWKDSTYLDPYFYDPNYTTNESIIDFGGLNYNGAFARGISFGSNQDLVVNSTLDLQLAGKIGDLEILAALTDNTIPIQPDGSTQQIQDFDKVYVQVKKDKHQFVAGDYGIQYNDGYFIRYDKQLQGASFKTGFDFKKGWQTNHSASFAIAKGKFARNTFNGKEGNQGPYKLVGANGETYIIILAGSEKIYADGKLLQRGEDNQYVMDYNTGEVVFTPKFMITKDIRLVIEFEYSDRNYFRTLLQTGHQVSYKGLKLYAQFYVEQDSKNKPIQANIDSTTENILKNIGNNIQDAIVPGARKADFSSSAIQYLLTDSIINGVYFDSIFVYTTRSDTQVYNVNFSYIGEGKGNYTTNKNTLNQRVYSWISPINGIPQGSYEPVELIITPKKDMYTNIGMQYEWGKTIVQSEIAYSDRDVNTFSTIGNKENRGLAWFNKFQRIDSIGKNKWAIQSQATYELKSENFQAPEQYRSVEFARDWNIKGNSRVQEHLVMTSAQVNNKDRSIETGVAWNYLKRQNLFQGQQQQYHFSYKKHLWDIEAKMNWMQAKDSLSKNSFLRPKVHISKTFERLWGLSLATGAYMEYNAIRHAKNDTLLSNSYFNNNIYASLKTSDTAFISGEFSYKYRKDYSPTQKEFEELTTSNEFAFNLNANRLKNQNLSITFTYRDLKIHDTLVSQLESDKNYLGRAEYGFKIKRGAIRWNTIYELGSGQERVREFTYLEVASGQGLYKWIDMNNDGVQQLDEFVIAQFADSANYVRVLTNVNEYIQARIVTLNQIFQLNPKAVWFNETGIKKFIARWNLNSSATITRKTFKGAQVSAFNPFILNTNDENVLSLNSSFRNSLYFNQGNPKFYFIYTWFFNQNKVILVNGFDTRNKNEQSIESNLNLPKSFAIQLKLLKGQNYANAEYSINNNYDYSQYKVNPSLSWVLKTTLRASIGYEFDIKRNIQELGGELAKGNKLNLDIRYSIASKQTIETKFSFVLFDYNGINGTTKAYQILDGLQPGKNYVWNAAYNRTLSNNLQLSISYDGRKTGTNTKIIHTGTATLRAMF
ncbi:MAG: hypothetical protein M9958_04870 [Chitinophagales bacterium]|nr:hypothetical protein [Chitinophagales bacterium]